MADRLEGSHAEAFEHTVLATPVIPALANVVEKQDQALNPSYQFCYAAMVFAQKMHIVVEIPSVNFYLVIAFVGI